MRVISQDGTADVPYDGTIFRVFDTYIHANCPARPGSPLLMARYKNEECAYKAMEMLREAYVGKPLIFQNIEVDDLDLEKIDKTFGTALFVRTEDSAPRFERVDDVVFRFPADDEVMT